MKNKGAIKVIAIVFALICIYQLSFTYFTKRVESNAKEYATNQFAQNEAKKLSEGNELRYQEVFDSISSARENAYLDSVSEQPVYNFLFMRKFTYKECKAREINLGLDLKGGMNVMMEVSTVDVIKNLAINPNDPVLVSLIDNATTIHRNDGGKYIDCFEKAVNNANNKQKIDLSSFFRVKLQDKGITATSSNSQVISAIRKECTDSYERTFQVLSKRIDKFGVAQPTIQKLDQSERIAIELPGIKDPQRVAKLLEGSAQLQFWLVEKDLNKAYKAIQEADSWLAAVNSGKSTEVNSESSTESVSELAESSAKANDTLSAVQKSHPLTSLFSSFGNPQMTLAVGTASSANKDEITRLLKDCKVLPKDIMFLWSAKPINKTNQYELYAIHLDKSRAALLDGDVISDAKDDFNQQGNPVVTMVMKSEAASKWAKITANHKGECIAIVLDSAVYSAPRVNSEITGGRSEISGSFTVDETKDLANILKSGKLTAPAKIVQESVVGPSLGEESIRAGMISFLFAFILVLIYMIFFYSTAGIAACVALICNLFFLFGVHWAQY